MEKNNNKVKGYVERVYMDIIKKYNTISMAERYSKIYSYVCNGDTSNLKTGIYIVKEEVA